MKWYCNSCQRFVDADDLIAHDEGYGLAVWEHKECGNWVKEIYESDTKPTATPIKE